MTCPHCLSTAEDADRLAADLHEAQREIETKRRQISAAYANNTVLRARVRELEKTVERQRRELAGMVWKRTRIG